MLKEYLIKGYAINQQVKIEQLEDLKHTVHLLMIAESRTEEKDIMTKVVVNLINKNNWDN